MSFKCVHLSDIHWRGLTRHDEYRESFSQMFEQVKTLNPDVIFIGGDIVHSKTQGISPELIDCLSWWFTQMAEICPTHIILGNHDGLILNKHRQDAITPIINALNNPNIYLYKNSGTYPTGIPGFNWSVFSCFDEEKWPNVKPVPGEINIATFHGGVNGSTTDIEWNIEGDVDVEFFKGYDFVMLGDIHKLQYLDPEKRIAYPGSTIQQNYGEDPGKGYLFWEIEDKDNFTSTFYEIPHSKPFVTIDWTGDVKETVELAKKEPDYARFRVRTNSPISQAEIKHLHSSLKEIKFATEIVFKHDHHVETSKIQTSSGELSTKDLRDESTQVSLVKEYYKDLDLEDEEWERITSLVHKYIQKATRADTVRNIKWSLKRLEFDNTFAYGKDNVIDFDTLSGITGLFGRNRSGKSSIPGTLMYNLFNTTDRGPIKNLHIINSRKGHCVARAMISANGKNYKIERQSVKKTNRRGQESAVTHLNLSEIDEQGVELRDLNGEQRRETEKTLRTIVGTADDFLMTSLASQGEMNNFIKHRATQRKNILTKFLDLEIFDEMYALAKEDSAAIKGQLANVPDRDWDILIAEKRSKKRGLKKERTETEGNIAKLRLQLQEMKIALATSDSKDLVTAADIESQEQTIQAAKEKLTALEEKAASLTSDIEVAQTKLETIEVIKGQFPIDDLRERLLAQQDLERTLLSLTHSHSTEKTLLKTQTKSVKLLEEVPCGDQFPTCKFIKESHKNKKKLEEQKKAVTDMMEKVRAARKSLNVLKREDLVEKIEKYDKILERSGVLHISLGNDRLDLSRTNTKKKALKETIDDAVRELQTMKMRVSDSDEADKVSEAKKEINRVTDEINSRDAERISLTETIGHLEAEIDKLIEEKKQYGDLIVQWRAYDLFMSAVSKKGIPLQIMSSQLPLINDEISKILTGVVGFTVELEAESGSNDMDIFINYGDSKRIIECASGMEKMMASLAIRVALINVSSLPKTDLLVIDEGFGALDDMNVESCNRLLASLKKWFRNILVISHVDAVKDGVDNVLDITQHNKNAKVIYE
ncbi:hypothetical protein CMK19_01115 [Candidatus Poribacteria bacterium]|nr:hypothetical protein [Candidatus Poribacteria bacterium]